MSFAPERVDWREDWKCMLLCVLGLNRRKWSVCVQYMVMSTLPEIRLRAEGKYRLSHVSPCFYGTYSLAPREHVQGLVWYTFIISSEKTVCCYRKVFCHCSPFRSILNIYSFNVVFFFFSHLWTIVWLMIIYKGIHPWSGKPQWLCKLVVSSVSHCAVAKIYWTHQMKTVSETSQNGLWLFLFFWAFYVRTVNVF